MRTLVSGLVMGLVLVGAGVALFRNRRRIVEFNIGMRRPVLGRFVTNGMAGGDRLWFPVLAVVFCAAGAALIVYTVYVVATGRGN